MFFSFGMDIGSRNTLISDKKGSIIYSDASCVAYDTASGRLIACGSAAEDHSERRGAVTLRFMERGMISDIYAAAAMLSSCMKKLSSPGLIKPNITAAVPSGLNNTACRALCDSLRLAGAHKISLVPVTLAAAVGLGLDICEHCTAVYVIGGSVCSFGVISMGCETAYRTIPVGMCDMDDALIRYVRKKHNILISRRTAEDIRHSIGCAYDEIDDTVGIWQGRSLAAGQSHEFELHSSETSAVYAPIAEYISDAMESVLDTVPPEVMSDVSKFGLTLAGGGAMLRGLDKLIIRRSGINASVSDEALTCAARGAGLLTGKNLRKELGIIYLYEGNS